MKDTLRLTPWRAALLPLSFLALSCGGGTPKPPPKDPPQATLTVPKPNTAGQKLTVMVSATGCDTIQSLSIYDREDFLKSVAYSGPGAVSVDLAINEIKYTRGIAAKLSLYARVVCSDGRQNDSQPAAATFFPAAEVIEAPLNTQLVTDNFVTEGTLPLIYFLGCGNLEGGIPTLFLVEKNNGVRKQKSMPFLCTNSTVITPKNPTTKKRWVWTPQAGAIAIDENLNISGQIDIPLDQLSVAEDGDAVITDTGSGGGENLVYRISHQNGAIKWTYTPRGFVISPPLTRADDVMIASITTTGAPSGRANIYVSRVDYGRQNPATGGIELGAFIMKTVASDITPTSAPPTAFNANGNLLYMAFAGVGGITQVFACKTEANGCTDTAQLWAEPPTLKKPIVALVPYGAGSRIAAIAAQQVWFLDANNGAILNKGGVDNPLIPNGGLVVLGVQSGGPPYAQSFYFLTGSAPTENLPSPQPLEIVATDDPAKGELYRYEINSGSISVAIDDAGTLWMRRGGDIVRPLLPPEYRQVRPVTP
ncbi:hypothetical protein [Hyalangium versicolor]|uniref:hypothetical protein n=1 Tax=Hyalangium versicolor TaxID=2861190 RepID=UPI001CCAF40E|nr:hypothetical protein [Hyalangium versicolor]